MFRIAAETGHGQLGRNVDQGFETIGAVIQGLQQCAPTIFQFATVERLNGLCARERAITGIDSYALLDPIQSVAKHATESLDGKEGVLSDRRRRRCERRIVAIVASTIGMLINESSRDLYFI